VLGHRRGFYGLVVEGWDLTDFAAPWPQGRLPAELDPSEVFVGFLDAERAGAGCWSAADFNDKAALYSRVQGLPAPRELSDAELIRVRAVRDDLIARWRALPPGETLELGFDRPA